MIETQMPDQVRGKTCFFHYSIRTEGACLQWIKRFFLFLYTPYPGNLDRVGNIRFRFTLDAYGGFLSHQVPSK